LFGIWKSREDLRDPASYVRDLRRPRHWSSETGVAKRPVARKPK
jgi:hypothetical protein